MTTPYNYAPGTSAVMNPNVAANNPTAPSYIPQTSMVNPQLAGVEREIMNANQQFSTAEQRLIMVWQMAEQIGYRLTRDQNNGLLRPLTPEEIQRRQMQMQQMQQAHQNSQPAQLAPELKQQLEMQGQAITAIMNRLGMLQNAQSSQSQNPVQSNSQPQPQITPVQS